MKEQTLPNGVTIEYFDSLDDLPIVRHQKFNEYIAVDAGIGSTMEDADKHLFELIQMIKRDDKESAFNKINNLRQNLQFAIENVSPKSMAFAVLINKVDGKPFNDITDLGLRNILTVISRFGLSYGMIKFIVEEVKKKLKRRLRSISRTSSTKANQQSSTQI